MKIIYLFGFLFFINIKCQTDSTKNFTKSFYSEFYYSFDSSAPLDKEKNFFLYNHKKHNQISSNISFGKASFLSKKFRANAALMVGDYAEFNLASEPEWARYILEANAGVKLSQSHNLWLDAGIFPSHIGFESVLGVDQPTVTRSLMAENSPYYETGAKITYQNKNQKLLISGIYLNGWQKINQKFNIKKPSFGFQINYFLNEQFQMNYSNYLGTNNIDEDHFRTFHNLYAIQAISDKTQFIYGLDIGTEKKNLKTKTWFTPNIIGKYKIDAKNNVALRAEYFHDPENLILSNPEGLGLKIFGTSVNYDYIINKQFLWRIEARYLSTNESVFQNKSNTLQITTTISIKI